MQLLELKRIPKERFFAEIGISSSNFRGTASKTPLNSDAIANTFTKIPDVNLEWLITGKGEMLKEDSLNIAKNDVKLWTVIESQQRTIEQNANTIAALTQQLAQKGDVAGAPGVAPTAARG